MIVVKKCPYCGFENPSDVGECLSCGRKFEVSQAEVQRNIEEMAQGKLGDVVARAAKQVATQEVSTIKHKFDPAWVVKSKVHELKRTAITLLWILGIGGGLFILLQILRVAFPSIFP